MKRRQVGITTVGLVLLIVVILLLLGALPLAPVGYGMPGALGIALIIVLVLIAMGKL